MTLLPASKFDNRFVRELPGDPDTRNFPHQVYKACWSTALPTPVKAPKLVASSMEVAHLLDLTPEDLASPEFPQVFSGNKLLPGMQAYAACYGGHQFGSWAGQLGDGRAIGLGEMINAAGERWEFQLKGAGPTPYSRTADGRAVLRSSIREFLCSEAMFHLGIPTTRALSLVTTGEDVIRDMLYNGNPRPEPGAIVCRVAPSFIRFGNFEIFAARQETDLLEKLLDFTIGRDFPKIKGDAKEKRFQFFKEVCERTAHLMVNWMRVGFVHGVMNTDNMSILGLTIDYGPYGWIDNYDLDWTPNTTDAGMHRYAFGEQPGIAYWNLTCLANALAPVFPSIDDLRAGLEHFKQTYAQAYHQMTDAKFGFNLPDDENRILAEQAYELLQQSEADMTSFFRSLVLLDETAPDFKVLSDIFYQEELRDRYQVPWTDWLQRYAQLLLKNPRSREERQAAMNAVNPRYVLRNYLAQEAIDLAEAGDFSRIHELMRVMANPYVEKEEYKKFAEKRPDWARRKVGCSMLSCSS